MASLVTRDAGVSDGGLAQRIEMFVNDTYTVESLIAQVSRRGAKKKNLVIR